MICVESQQIYQAAMINKENCYEVNEVSYFNILRRRIRIADFHIDFHHQHVHYN